MENLIHKWVLDEEHMPDPVEVNFPSLLLLKYTNSSKC